MENEKKYVEKDSRETERKKNSDIRVLELDENLSLLMISTNGFSSYKARAY
mgnify:CR=1 FL=1